MRLTFSRAIFLVLLSFLQIAIASCQTDLSSVSLVPGELEEVNTAINAQSRPCPNDYCLKDWPEVFELEQLEYWDCKAYVVAKADRLIHRFGYEPARLEYLLVSGSPLRVTHAALLVDERWVLDSGVRCQQVCELEAFVAGLRIAGRLPVADLPYVREMLHTTSTSIIHF